MAQWVILSNVFVRQVRQETVTGACVKHYLTHSAVERRQAIIETVSGKTTPTPQTNPLALLLTNPTMIWTLMVVLIMVLLIMVLLIMVLLIMVLLIMVLLIMVLLITPTPPLIRALEGIENNNFVVVGLKEN